jgi:EmrB/QacA subfamily drug resistance transporter
MGMNRSGGLLGTVDSLDTGTRPTGNYRTVALVAASLAVLFMTLTASSLNVALPSINREFGSDAIVLSWIVTSFVLSSAVFSVPFGRIADIVGLKKIFLYGMILFTLTSFVAVFSNSSVMLIICRSVQGLAGAMIAVNSIAMVTAIYPLKERGRVLGINIACVYAGSSMGPFLGGILTERLGWRSIFAINIPVGLLVILLLLWKVKGEWSECRGEKFDYTGSIIYGFALIVLMYGFSILPGISGGLLVILGIVGLLAFLWWESRSTVPVLNINIFRHNRPFILSNLAALISYTSIFAIAFLLSLYLQYIRALTPEQAGLVLVVQPVTQTLLTPFTGRLSDKVEPRILTSAGMALIFFGLLTFSFLSHNTPTWEVIVVLVVLGVGFALFSSPNSNAVMSSVAPKYFGVASAVMSTMRSVGQMFSMGITMIIMAVVIGRVTITPEYYPVFLTSTKIAFGAFSVLCMVGIFTSLSRGKVR